jgi:hypothetical protein
MEDIPQPSDTPYSTGDRVCVYLSPDDPDSRFHGTVCEVVEVFTDNLDSETDRELDRYSYRVQRVDDYEMLPVQFRHTDLVPE